MITVRPASGRGQTNLGWLDSRHTFSFGGYHDADQMGFGDLRVLNDDHVEPGGGFGTHGHRDMEILSFVLSGSLEHKDSMGTGSVLRPGDVQRMSAGTGVTHSEFNPSKRAPVHFLQVWILPDRTGIEPEFHQDASVYRAALEAGQSAEHRPAPGRRVWLQVARGAVTLNGVALKEGDGASVTGERSLTLAGQSPSDVLLFDLA